MRGMFEETQLKTGQSPERDPAMERQSVMDRVPVIERLREMGKWLFSPLPMPTAQESVGWHNGSCVDPTGFTEQLSRLQVSLHSANRAVTQDLVADHAMMHHAVSQNSAEASFQSSLKLFTRAETQICRTGELGLTTNFAGGSSNSIANAP
jgi:hypothetical protein